MPKPYPREFREDVVAVARRRENGVTLAQVAKDFGISESCLINWLRAADVEDGRRHCCVGRVCGLGQWSDDELSTVVRTSRLPVPA